MFCHGGFGCDSGGGRGWGPVCRTPKLDAESLKLLGGNDPEFLLSTLSSSQNPQAGGVTLAELSLNIRRYRLCTRMRTSLWEESPTREASAGKQHSNDVTDILGHFSASMWLSQGIFIPPWPLFSNSSALCVGTDSLGRNQCSSTQRTDTWVASPRGCVLRTGHRPSGVSWKFNSEMSKGCACVHACVCVRACMLALHGKDSDSTGLGVRQISEWQTGEESHS